MPSGNRTDKTMHTSNDHRLNLAHLLAENLRKNHVIVNEKKAPEIIVSTTEIDRTIPTATIDTLRELERTHPDSEFYFIISSELVPDIRKFWDEGEELFKNAKFIILERAGSHTLGSLELPPFSTVIPPGADTVPEISSTILRELNTQEKLSEWTDKESADYIIQNKIYGFKKEN
jgi:nicotinic acid mononucleotide adenylyltransferase